MESGCCCCLQNEYSIVLVSLSYPFLIHSLGWVHLIGQTCIRGTYPSYKRAKKAKSGPLRFYTGMWAVSHWDSFSGGISPYTKQETWAIRINKEERERKGKEKKNKYPPQKRISNRPQFNFSTSPTNTSNSMCSKVKSPSFTPKHSSYSLSFLGI